MPSIKKKTNNLPADAPQPKSLLGYHRQLSPTAAVKVSPLCLGGMGFGTAWEDIMGSCDKEASFELMDYFYSQGGNFIDTWVAIVFSTYLGKKMCWLLVFLERVTTNAESPRKSLANGWKHETTERKLLWPPSTRLLGSCTTKIQRFSPTMAETTRSLWCYLLKRASRHCKRPTLIWLVSIKFLKLFAESANSSVY